MPAGKRVVCKHRFRHRHVVELSVAQQSGGEGRALLLQYAERNSSSALSRCTRFPEDATKSSPCVCHGEPERQNELFSTSTIHWRLSSELPHCDRLTCLSNSIELTPRSSSPVDVSASAVPH